MSESTTNSATASHTEPDAGHSNAGAFARLRAVLANPRFHVVLLVAGSLFLLTDAFHGNIWFDESYSVGIANHSFADIWYYSSGDVHPVLIYWALHVLNLVFGQNITVYRLFTVAGAIALATLGYTHVRRDSGWKVGVLFSFFALFTPYISLMSVEIRMYSWATFAVMLCFIYAMRIIDTQLSVIPPAIAQAAKGKKCWAGTPRSWWLTCFIASLACAYLHYFGAMSAFMINLVLLVALCVRAWQRRRGGPAPLPDGKRASAPLIVLIIGCVAQVALYVPWILTAVTSQMGVVGGTYWANIVLPTTYIELATYPFSYQPLVVRRARQLWHRHASCREGHWIRRYRGTCVFDRLVGALGHLARWPASPAAPRAAGPRRRCQRRACEAPAREALLRMAGFQAYRARRCRAGGVLRGVRHFLDRFNGHELHDLVLPLSVRGHWAAAVRRGGGVVPCAHETSGSGCNCGYALRLGGQPSAAFA